MTAPDESAELLKLERSARRLISRLAGELMAPAPRGGDVSIVSALRDVAELLDGDHAFVYLLASDGESASNLHDWCRAGVTPMQELCPAWPVREARWWWQCLEGAGTVVVPRVDDMPASASMEQELFRAMGLQALCAVALRRDGKLLGFLGVGCARAPRPWAAGTAEVLGSVATILTAAMAARTAAAPARAQDNEVARLERMERMAGIGLWELNLVSGEFTWSAGLHRLLGTDPAAFKPSYEYFLGQIHPQDRAAVNHAYQQSLMTRQPYRLVHRLLMRDGSVRHVEEWCETEYSADGRALVTRGALQDVSGRVANEEALERIAFSDRLTGLPNRAGMSRNLQQAMDVARSRGRRLALGVLDIDDFKDVNESRGQAAGDALLKLVAQRLALLIPGEGHIARLGGDEFAVLITGVGDAADSVPLVMRVLAMLSEPLVHDGHPFRLTASIGVTLFPQDRDLDADQLLRQAQQALYQAKLLGKNRYHLHDPSQEDAVLSQTENLREVRVAMARRGFELFYQPKVNMRTGEVIGAEALIRWRHPDRGLLSPGEFLPWIKDHPLDVELGERVLEDGLRQSRSWRAEGFNFPVSVNVSAQQLLHPRFLPRLQDLLQRYPTPEGMLELEILESSAMQDLQSASEVMRRARALGVTFALDDFGTGYASLAYLRKLPASTLKVEQGFVKGMRASSEDLAIINAVVGMGRAFDMRVVAEGVDTLATGELLLRLGCDLAQGYAILPPSPAERVTAWIHQWKTPQAWTQIPAADEADLKVLLSGVEHERWLRALRAYLKEEGPALPLDVAGCGFGGWLHGEGIARYGEQPVFKSVCQRHDALHHLAAELDRLRDEGRRNEVSTRLHELDELSERMLEELVRLPKVG